MIPRRPRLDWRGKQFLPTIMRKTQAMRMIAPERMLRREVAR
jgi:hypothetical protein